MIMQLLLFSVDCPPLSINQHNGNIALSTFENAVGTLVTFLCRGPEDFLSGTPALQCTRKGKWNGTVPMCLKQSGTVMRSLYIHNLSCSAIFITSNEKKIQQFIFVILDDCFLSGT